MAFLIYKCIKTNCKMSQMLLPRLFLADLVSWGYSTINLISLKMFALAPSGVLCGSVFTQKKKRKENPNVIVISLSVATYPGYNIKQQATALFPF